VIEVKPSAAGAGLFRSLAVLGAIVGVVQGLVTGKGVSAATVLPGVIAIALIFGVTEVWKRTSRIRRDDDGSVWRWQFGVPKQPRTAHAGIYLPHVVNGFGVPVARLALFDKQGKAVLRIGSEFWDPEALDLFARSFEPALAVISEEMSGKDALAKYPEALAYRERHPRLFPTIIVGICVGVTGLIVVAALLFG
jgi:hypothetical protein